MKLYEVCKKNRLLLGLSEDEFASSLNINSKLYKDFEDGKYLFSKEIVKDIISALYIEKEDLTEKYTNEEDLENYITNVSLKVIEECEKGE